MTRRLSAMLAVALLAGAEGVTAQSWPDRPIRLIVPTGPGAATDLIARLLSEDVARQIGQPLIVENRAGASGLPAHQAAAHSEPDGYTFLFTNTSGLASNIVSFRTLPYDPTKDFAAVAMVVNLGPQLIAVNTALPVKSMVELVDYAKANPGKINYGVDITSGAALFFGRLLNKRANLGLVEVTYKAARQLVQDAASGTVPIVVTSISVASPFLQTGQLRPIAVTSGSRFPSMADVQAVNETFPGLQLDGWFAVVAPRGTPPAIVSKMNAAIDIFLKRPETQKRLLENGLATSGSDTPEHTGQFINEQQDLWRALAKELDIQPQQ